MLSSGNKILQKVFRTFNDYYYLNGLRKSPTKQDHPQDAMDQEDGDIYIELRVLSGRRGKATD
jgi:hypothetical protein